MSNLATLKNTLLKHRLTLLPEKNLLNIELCLRAAVAEGIDGDFIETGVWKGGAVIYAHAVIKELVSDKRTIAADSFEGLPKPDLDNFPEDAGDEHWTDPNLAVSLESVQNNFKVLGELDEKVVFLKGWFKDTLSSPLIDKLCVLRLDGDMYESTWEALDKLYPKLSIGGYCIIDDYGHPRCIQAVNDYREIHNITDEMFKVDDNWEVEPTVWWKKTSSG